MIIPGFTPWCVLKPNLENLMSKTKATGALQFKNPTDDLDARKQIVAEIQASNLDAASKNRLIKDVTEDNLDAFKADSSDPDVLMAIATANNT